MERAFLANINVYLRPLEVDDITNEYLNWVNDYEVIRYIDIKFPITREKQEEYVRSMLKRNDIAFFAVIEKSTDKFIGTAKLGPINWFDRFTEHAIMIGDKTAWGKKYAGEIIQLLLEYGFRWLNMHKIYAGVIGTNIASIKKNERIGYKTEAVLKEKKFFNGKYVNHIIMSISSDEFFELYPEPISHY